MLRYDHNETAYRSLAISDESVRCACTPLAIFARTDPPITKRVSRNFLERP